MPAPHVAVPEEFETARLIIRAPHAQYAGEVNTAVRESFARLRLWMPWAQEVPTLAQTDSHLQEAEVKFINREDLMFLAFEKETKAFVVGTGLHRIDWRIPKFEIGYWVRTSHEGQGYATEAAAALMDLAFRSLGAKRVEIRCSSRNELSWRIAERLNFELEGILRNERLEMDGTVGDTRIYGKTPNY